MVLNERQTKRNYGGVLIWIFDAEYWRRIGIRICHVSFSWIRRFAFACLFHGAIKVFGAFLEYLCNILSAGRLIMEYPRFQDLPLDHKCERRPKSFILGVRRCMIGQGKVPRKNVGILVMRSKITHRHERCLSVWGKFCNNRNKFPHRKPVSAFHHR